MEKKESRGVDADDWTPDDWERVFDRGRCNAVMFVELFWNVAYSDKKASSWQKWSSTCINHLSSIYRNSSRLYVYVGGMVKKYSICERCQY